MKLLDYHIHIERGPYSLSRLEQFLETAQARGVAETGISEHGHLFRDFADIMKHLGAGEGSHPRITKWLPRHFSRELDEYMELIEKAKLRGFPVKLGVEVDYIPGYEQSIAKWLEGIPWDYVIGSVHFIGKWGFDHSPDVGWPDRDVAQAYHQYFELLAAAAQTGLFDIIGHFDVIKVFGHIPSSGRPLSHRSFVDQKTQDLDETRMWVDKAVINTLEAIKAAGCCLEINTAGWRRPVGEIPGPGNPASSTAPGYSDYPWL